MVRSRVVPAAGGGGGDGGGVMAGPKIESQSLSSTRRSSLPRAAAATSSAADSASIDRALSRTPARDREVCSPSVRSAPSMPGVQKASLGKLSSPSSTRSSFTVGSYSFDAGCSSFDPPLPIVGTSDTAFTAPSKVWSEESRGRSTSICCIARSLVSAGSWPRRGNTWFE